MVPYTGLGKLHHSGPCSVWTSPKQHSYNWGNVLVRMTGQFFGRSWIVALFYTELTNATNSETWESTVKSACEYIVSWWLHMLSTDQNFLQQFLLLRFASYITLKNSYIEKISSNVSICPEAFLELLLGDVWPINASKNTYFNHTLWQNNQTLVAQLIRVCCDEAIMSLLLFWLNPLRSDLDCGVPSEVIGKILLSLP